MTVDTDRRSKLRKRPLSLVYVELATGNGGMMRDLCEEGFALRAMMPMRPGDISSFTFSLDPATRVEGEGRTIWVEEGGRVAGLEFTKLSPEGLQNIRSWLQRVDEATAREEEVPVAPAPKNNPTLDELRQEARTVAVRPPAAKQDTPRPPKQDQPRPPKQDQPRAGGSRGGDVTVFPAPPRSEPRDVPSPEELKREIAEALRQAAAEHFNEEDRSKKIVEEERPPVQAAPPPPPPPPPVAAPEPPPPAPAVHAPMTPLWATPNASFEALPTIDERDFVHGRRPGRSRGWSFIFFLLLAGLAVGGYVYRRQVGQVMIQAGQKISDSPQTTASRNTGESLQPPNPSGNSADTGTKSTALPDSSNHPASESPAAAQQDATSTSPAGSSGSAAVPPSANSGSPDVSADSKTNPAAASPSYVSPSRSNPASIIPVSPLVSSGKPAGTLDTSTEAGQSEYSEAIQLLRGKNGRADTAEAARLLWTAVEKGNSNAEVALAELYRLGQGVGQNCDQARVLLTAAARKGNPEGVRHLQLFEQAGCE
jgi:hypothetical protein